MVGEKRFKKTVVNSGEKSVILTHKWTDGSGVPINKRSDIIDEESFGLLTHKWTDGTGVPLDKR